MRASLKSGRVFVRRQDGDRCAFELSLLLAPAEGEEPLKVEARVEAAVAR